MPVRTACPIALSAAERSNARIARETRLHLDTVRRWRGLDCRQRLLPPRDRCNATAQPFQWKFTTSDLDDLLAGLDRHTTGHQEESSVAPAA
ncbi:hypothetical protein LKL35_00545 [Streptomyces sp. ET3-23]|uniref:hypothetical protein n=1 Tax=Streptomyces sp. ET3-23 TaxID=2885643 RepID=UPI001D11281F|nr:hypothetical protein [Streptomyces sp. ET3-23]MCC2273943.1 hypothetical protein [Streptomyces sp. ET3-23]